MDLFYWSFTGLALIGVVLNLKKDKRCFYFWSLTNAAFAVESFLVGALNMTFLFSIYFVLALWGIYKW